MPETQSLQRMLCDHTWGKLTIHTIQNQKSGALNLSSFCQCHCCKFFQKSSCQSWLMCFSLQSKTFWFWWCSEHSLSMLLPICGSVAPDAQTQHCECTASDWPLGIFHPNQCGSFNSTFSFHRKSELAFPSFCVLGFVGVNFLGDGVGLWELTLGCCLWGGLHHGCNKWDCDFKE